MITVISHWYNEELLAPLFFRHYGYADWIIILLDTDTNDSTMDICLRYPNVIIKDVYADGNDDRNITANKNREISQVKDGWIYVVDADEFIFPEGFENPEIFLKRQKADVVNTLNFHVYRHITDADIDYNVEVIPQRVHARYGKIFKDWFMKPSVIRASTNIQVGIGCHTLIGDHRVSRERYIGAHWKLADREIAVRRRLSNKKRMSQNNLKKGYANHEFNITEERILRSLKDHENLPVLDLLVGKGEGFNFHG